MLGHKTCDTEKFHHRSKVVCDTDEYDKYVDLLGSAAWVDSLQVSPQQVEVTILYSGRSHEQT